LPSRIEVNATPGRQHHGGKAPVTGISSGAGSRGAGGSGLSGGSFGGGGGGGGGTEPCCGGAAQVTLVLASTTNISNPKIRKTILAI